MLALNSPGQRVYRQWVLLSGAVLGLSGLARGQAPGELLSIDRMGSGCPAGWLVDGQDYTWEAERGSGPLGVGPARVRLGKDGRLMCVSPAGYLPAGRSYAACIWIRSEPAGAHVELELRDNDGREKVLLNQQAQASTEWQRIVAKVQLPRTTKDRYYLRLHVRGRDCTLWLDGLWFGPHDGATDATWTPKTFPAVVSLKPQAAWGLAVGDEPLGIDATVVGVRSPGCKLDLRTVHTSGASESLPSVTLDGSGWWKGSLAVSGQAARSFGMIRLEATVMSAEGTPLSRKAETLLARAPQPVPGPLPTSPFGVHVSLREPDLSVVAKLGYKWCRIHDASGITKWGYAEPQPGQWVWFDKQVALARQKGLSILGMLDGSPPWESGLTETGYFSIYGAPRNIDNWRNYVRQVVTHYAGQIDEWEVWNEPWNPMGFFKNGNPMLYAKLLKAAYQEARKVNPRCTIVGIDTYPPIWDRMVLGFGAYPYYDVLSWHRYDPTLFGRPDDPIERVSKRLAAEQKRYGTPKPLMFSEGGPDVTIFHGSFFSFADPVLTGDWSRAADGYARMFLSSIAAGNQRFIAYSVHNSPRHGLSTHMMVEPGYLLRPIHLALAGMAHCLEGARYERRLVPLHDVSAHVFHQTNNRPYAQAPSTVVALIADGEDAEDLPRALPSGVRCFDRWGNPAPVPTQATRSPVYLIATGSVATQLIEALTPATPQPVPTPVDTGTVEALLNRAVRSLAQAEPPLWKLLSIQGAVVAFGGKDGSTLAHRGKLKTDSNIAARFRLPVGVRLDRQEIVPAGELTTGQAEVSLSESGSPSQRWTLVFTAVKDGSRDGWRFSSLAIIPVIDTPDADAAKGPIETVRRVERSIPESRVLALRDHLYTESFCAALCKPDGESYWFTDMESFVTMMDHIAVWGSVTKSRMITDTVVMAGDLTAVRGRWEIASPFFGSVPYTFSAVTIRQRGQWRLASLCCSAPADATTRTRPAQNPGP